MYHYIEYLFHCTVVKTDKHQWSRGDITFHSTQRESARRASENYVDVRVHQI